MERIIVVFGGSFNPPHNFHFAQAEQMVSDIKNVEKVIFLPVGDKYQKDTLISAEHRYAMLKLICDKNEKFDLSRIEIDARENQCTIDSLNEIQKFYPNCKIYFAGGTDEVRDLPNWKEYQNLLSQYKMVVYERDEDQLDEIINQMELIKPYRDSFILLPNKIRSNVSSSLLREKVGKNSSIRYLVPEEVYQYIKKNQLYQNL